MNKIENKETLSQVLERVSSINGKFFEKIIGRYGGRVLVGEKAFCLIEKWWEQGYLMPREKGELFNLLTEFHGKPKPHKGQFWGRHRCESYTERQTRG